MRATVEKGKTHSREQFSRAISILKGQSKGEGAESDQMEWGGRTDGNEGGGSNGFQFMLSPR